MPTWQVIGILQAIWNFTEENCPLGDIGKFSNSDIAFGIGYEGDPDELIYVLYEEHWLDKHKDDKIRLIIHDWHEHVPEYIKKRISRSGKQFFSEDLDNIISYELSKCPDSGGQCLPLSAVVCLPNPTQPDKTQTNKTEKNLCRVESKNPDSLLSDDFDSPDLPVSEKPDSPDCDQPTTPAKKPKPGEENFDARLEWLWKQWPSQRRTTRKEVIKSLKAALKRATWADISTGAKVYTRSPYVTSRLEMGETSSIKTLPAWLNADRWEIQKDALLEPCRTWADKHKNDPPIQPTGNDPPVDPWENAFPEPVRPTEELLRIAYGD